MMANDIPAGESFLRQPPTNTLNRPNDADTPFDWNSIADRQPINFRQLLLLLFWTALADLLIFRTLGLTGPATFFFVTPLLFLAHYFLCANSVDGGRTTDNAGKTNTAAIVVVVGLLWLVALRMIWLGTGLNVFSGMVLLIALAMTSCGHLPLVLEGAVYAARVGLDGLLRITGNRSRIEPPRPVAVASQDSAENNIETLGENATWTTGSWLMPIAAALVFGGIFVMANPDLLNLVSEKWSRGWEIAWNWISGLSAWEIPFCLCAFVLGAGLLMPVLPIPKFGPSQSFVDITGDSQQSATYAAFRNTLCTLIVLFGVYLAFEFYTLWRQAFPDGFYYAGYAHQGAAWLTFALALATGLLSAVFSGKILQDPRLSSLRSLSWIWSAQNFLLAAAVYNRLMIYVGYNGMTRMRTIGFFGITVVVIGFVLVLYKIARNRSFWWLIRAQLIALVLTVIAYGLFPVDWVAHRYNANRVVDGYLHPSVMIAVKPIDNEGLGSLLSLTQVDDRVIREGVLAILADRQLKIENESQEALWHWTKYQASTSSLYEKLSANQTQWSNYLKNPKARREAIVDFRNYAMQWY